jgi:hypothetical protein
MRFVRGHGEARWMPSRHNFALFRLFAFLRLRSAKHEEEDTILVVDRHQSNVETMAVTIWLVLTAACCLAVEMSWLAALVVAVLGIQLAQVLTALIIAPLLPVDGVRVSSIVVMTLVAAVAAYAATRPVWLRFAGWQFFALFALNAVAALIMFLLRDSVERLEASIGGASSAH